MHLLIFMAESPSENSNNGTYVYAKVQLHQSKPHKLRLQFRAPFKIENLGTYDHLSETIEEIRGICPDLANYQQGQPLPTKEVRLNREGLRELITSDIAANEFSKGIKRN